jgi:hypothetical protein
MTKSKIEDIKRHAEALTGFSLFNKECRQIKKTLKEWEVDIDFSCQNRLDTLERDYLWMAVIEVIMPDKPTVIDDFIGETDNWHVPCYGSSPEYTKAFIEKIKEVALTRQKENI